MNFVHTRLHKKKELALRHQIKCLFSFFFWLFYKMVLTIFDGIFILLFSFYFCWYLFPRSVISVFFFGFIISIGLSLHVHHSFTYIISVLYKIALYSLSLSSELRSSEFTNSAAAQQIKQLDTFLMIFSLHQIASSSFLALLLRIHTFRFR